MDLPDLTAHYAFPDFPDPEARSAFLATLRRSLDASADEEIEKMRACIACPPPRALSWAIETMFSVAGTLERWTTDRCLVRYRQMRR